MENLAQYLTYRKDTVNNEGCGKEEEEDGKEGKGRRKWRKRGCSEAVQNSKQKHSLCCQTGRFTFQLSYLLAM